MKTIKVNGKEYTINYFDYFWDGDNLLLVYKSGCIVEKVHKKYFAGILVENNTTMDCGMSISIPKTVLYNKKGYKFISMQIDFK